MIRKLWKYFKHFNRRLIEDESGLVWFAPLIAAGISAIGAITGAGIQRGAAQRQIQATKDANRVMNLQWRQEMNDRKQEMLTQQMIKFRESFNNDMVNHADLRKRMVGIWSGRS